MVPELVGALLDLLDDLDFGDPPPRRHPKVKDYLAEAKAQNAAELAVLYGGEPNVKIQNVAYELKLLDALFEASLAPCVGQNTLAHLWPLTIERLASKT